MAVSWRFWGFCIFSAFLASFSTTARSAEVSAADCTNLVLDLADCLSFVVEGSRVTNPQGDCCPGLKTVLNTNAECLCEAFKNNAQLGVKLNVTRVMTLPAVCRVSSSVANCSSSGGSGEAPASSPFSEPPSSGVETPSPTTVIGVNEVISPPAPGKSGSSSLVTSVSVWMFFLPTTVAAAVVLFASI